MSKTVEQTIREVIKISTDINRVDKLGGRDSFFGLKEIFEIVLREEHEKITPEEVAEDYPFRGYRGMECYGNIIHAKYCQSAIDRCMNDYKFAQWEWQRIYDWYIGRNSPDTVVCALYIKWQLKDKYEITLIKNE